MRIVITGAAGRIGREVSAELRDHVLVLLDRRLTPASDIVEADVAWPGRWMSALRGADCIVHLAANPGPEKRLRQLIRSNLMGPLCVVVGAVFYRVPRVVFASSGWVVMGVEEALAPDCYRPDGPKVDERAFGPRTAYGWSKAWGEVLGRLLVWSRGVRDFLAVRIGWYASPKEKADDDRVLTIWIGSEDIRRFFRRAIEARYSGFHVTYAVSAQATAPYALASTTRLLDWEPREIGPVAR